MQNSAEDIIKNLQADNTMLRKALVGLVGVDTKLELEQMEAFIRVTPMPNEDRMNTINAIHALRDTLPQANEVPTGTTIITASA